jgi:hypothetical protein
MNDRLLELEIQKILQEYKLLLIDEEYKNEMISINKGDFLKEINKKGGFPPEPEVPVIPEEESDKVEEASEVEEEDLEVDEKTTFIKEGMKKLYRQIVKLTHPDKTMHKNNKKELSDLYIRSKKAIASMDVYELLTICDKLDIKYNIDINQKDILEENLLKKKEQLKSLEVSFIWLWIKATTDIEKESIVDLFIQKHKKNI